MVKTYCLTYTKTQQKYTLKNKQTAVWKVDPNQHYLNTKLISEKCYLGMAKVRSEYLEWSEGFQNSAMIP